MKVTPLLLSLALIAIALPASGQTFQKFNDSVSSGGGRSSAVIGAETFHIIASVGDLVAPRAPAGSMAPDGPLFIESGFIATLSATLTADPAADGVAVSWKSLYAITTFAPEADLDKDGLIDLLEAAFNLDPGSPDAPRAYSQSIVSDSGSKYLQLVYRRHKGHSAITLEPLRSTGLDAPGWTTTGITVVSTNEIDPDTDVVTVRSSTPVSGEAKQFMRLRATYTPPAP